MKTRSVNQFATSPRQVGTPHPDFVHLLPIGCGEGQELRTEDRAFPRWSEPILCGDSYRVAGNASASAVVAQPAAVIEMN